MPSPRHRPLLLEMVFIVLAIVLGFAVTSFDTARRERARAAQAVDRIRLELEANRDALAQTTPYYRAITITLDSLLNANGDTPMNPAVVPGWRGVAPPSLRTASFTIATSTGAMEHVDFEIADQLALAYEGLADFSTALDNAIGATMNGNVHTLSDWLLVLAFLGEIAANSQATLTQTLTTLPATP